MTGLDDVVDELYGGALDDFVARRDAAVRAARAAKDRDLAGRIGSLRKPTLAAWTVNLLVRDDPTLVDTLRELGEGMRDAQRSLDGPALRELGTQRRALVSGLVARARRLAADAGQKVSTAAAQEVEHTLTAALADPRVAAAVAAGTLTHGTEHVGFGSVGAEAGDGRTPAPSGGDGSGGDDSGGDDPTGEPPDTAARGRGRGAAPTGVHVGGRAGARTGSAAAAKAAGTKAAGTKAAGTKAAGTKAAGTKAAGAGAGAVRAAAEERRDRERREREQERLRRRHEQAVAAREAAETELDRIRTRHDDAAEADREAVGVLEAAERASSEAYATERELVEALADVRRRLAAARAALPRVDEGLVAARVRARDQEKALRATRRELDRATAAADRAREQERRTADDLP